MQVVTQRVEIIISLNTHYNIVYTIRKKNFVKNLNNDLFNKL